MKDILVIEPFYGGSHEQLVKLLLSDSDIAARADVLTLPAKKWHWRARTSALYFSQTIPHGKSYRYLFSSSVLNLAELVALRPDLTTLKKIVYFHENQLVYPVRKKQNRDFQYGYNEILSSMVADAVVFNSTFNMESFLTSISSHLKLIPDHRPKGIDALIRPKCSVLHFPIPQCEAKLPSTEFGVFHSSQDSEMKMDVSDNYLEKSSISSAQVMSGAKINKEVFASSDSPNITTVKGFSEVNVEAHPVPQNTSFISDVKSEMQEKGTSDSEKSTAEIDFNSEEHVKAISKYVAVSLSAEVCENVDLNKPISSVSDNSNLSAVEKISSFTDTDLETAVFHKSHTVVNLSADECNKGQIDCSPLHIVWPHRWEHDKDPEAFFRALISLKSDDYNFKVSVLGEAFSEVPDIFDSAKDNLKDHILNWGHQTKEDYLNILRSADVVVSTALHEFFGVSMLEAVSQGCYPLCPKRLVYPEIYPDDCLYSTQAQLVKKLKRFCSYPKSARKNKYKHIASRYSWQQLQNGYRKLFQSKPHELTENH